MAFKLSEAFRAHIKKRGNPLSYDREMYRYPDTARNIPDPRAEYRKLRNVAMNRIRKLEKAGYGGTETVRQARRAFSQLPKNLTQDQAAQALPEAARFITSARGTVGGMRDIERKTAETFQDRGLDFVNPKNVRRFGEFLDWLGEDTLESVFYEAADTPPKEGGEEKKRFTVEKLKNWFNVWQKINDY